MRRAPADNAVFTTPHPFPPPLPDHLLPHPVTPPPPPSLAPPHQGNYWWFIVCEKTDQHSARYKTANKKGSVFRTKERCCF